MALTVPERLKLIRQVADSRYHVGIANAALLRDEGFEIDEIANILFVDKATARRYVSAGRKSDLADHLSDGFHTMTELYDYRMAYNALAAKFMKECGLDAVKSYRHHDGEPCLGGGWFIVVIDLPGFGQVSNHYKNEFWDLFDAEVVERAPEWDGHTPAVALERMLGYLNQK